MVYRFVRSAKPLNYGSRAYKEHYSGLGFVALFCEFTNGIVEI